MPERQIKLGQRIGAAIAGTHPFERLQDIQFRLLLRKMNLQEFLNRRKLDTYAAMGILIYSSFQRFQEYKRTKEFRPLGLVEEIPDMFSLTGTATKKKRQEVKRATDAPSLLDRTDAPGFLDNVAASVGKVQKSFGVALKETLEAYRQAPIGSFSKGIYETAYDGVNYAYDESIRSHVNLQRFIVDKGLGTATHFTRSLLLAIPDVYAKQHDGQLPTVSEYMSIVKASYKTLAQMAGQNIHVFAPLFSKLQGREGNAASAPAAKFLTQHFFIGPDNRIQIDPQVLKVMQDAYDRLPESEKEKTFGCPALPGRENFVGMQSDPINRKLEQLAYRNVIDGFFQSVIDTIEATAIADPNASRSSILLGRIRRR